MVDPDGMLSRQTWKYITYTGVGLVIAGGMLITSPVGFIVASATTIGVGMVYIGGAVTATGALGYAISPENPKAPRASPKRAPRKKLRRNRR